ncbi:hypothetical protein [Piscinibacter gummiphilus]|uniref:PDZ domain-containing protein n=1 Tax=Piscinibacter gummiphilus TaxID=946333 RepID=A0ABZ0CX86_9BURK|nr:hypothetical protein [Piscinibacter gummiphilus]WOB09571.1 hypothetical protein RXV79_05785 [Piscinibacter gummiphilus]
MSGFIHITHKTPAWQKLLRTASGLAVVVGGFAWYVLSDEGLPMNATTADAKAPFVKAQPLPAPPPTAMAADKDDAQAERQPAKAAASLGTDTHDDDDYAARNAGIDVHRLTLLRHQTARSFLSEVLLTEGSPSGFVVAEVLPESRYERMGLKPGDVIYTLDTPGTPPVDENSMVALMQQTELSLEVYRNGALTRLHTNLAKLEDGNVGSKP